jgi:hypothetical protein
MKITVTMNYDRYLYGLETSFAPKSKPLDGSFADPNSPLSQASDRALNPNSGPGFSDPRLEETFQRIQNNR